MQRAGACWCLVVILGASGVGLLSLGGCKRDKESSAEEDEPREKKSKKKDEKKDESSKAAEDELDIMATFGADSRFGGAFDLFDNTMFGATSHSPEEPNNFSAGWVGAESASVLKRAIAGEFPRKQVRIGPGRFCLVFTENNIVRRAMIATAANAPTEEFAFSQTGNVIFWHWDDRTTPQSNKEWAFFHQGTHLMLFHKQLSGGARHEEAAPVGRREHVLAGARACVQAAGALNPAPGAAPPPAPAPSPTPVAGFFGAIAVSPQTNAWRISLNQTSQEAANADAVANCQPNCTVRQTFGTGECMSVVHTPVGGLSWSWGPDNNATAQSAVKHCTDQGHPASGCVVQGTWCNNHVTPPPPPPPPPAPAPSATGACQREGQFCILNGTTAGVCMTFGSLACATPPGIFHHDGCAVVQEQCMCSNTGTRGACDVGPLKEGLYCHCD